MLNYTSTISDDLTTITIEFISVVTIGSGSIIELLDSTDTPYTVVNSTTIQFEVIKDSEYLITFFDIELNDYNSSYLLVNSRAILCSDRKNRRDVNNLLKVKKLDDTSKLTDCLNRVVIANHRLSHYQRAAEILQITNTNCEGETCQC